VQAELSDVSTGHFVARFLAFMTVWIEENLMVGQWLSRADRGAVVTTLRFAPG